MGIMKRISLSVIFLILFIGISLNSVYSETLEIALICQGSGCGHNKDGFLIEHLNDELNHTLAFFAASDLTPSDLAGIDVIVISSSIINTTQIDWLKNTEIGILSVHGSTNNEFWLADYGNVAGGDSTTGIITDSNHTITQVYKDGITQVATQTGKAGYMRQWDSGDGDPLAVYTSNLKRAKILVLEKDDLQTNGQSAPERRAFFGAHWFEYIKEPEGRQIFDKTLEWTSNTGLGISSLNVLLVCNGTNCGHLHQDAPLRDYIDSKVSNLDTKKASDPTPWDLTGYQLIVISPTANPSTVAWLNNEEKGILTIKGSSNDEFLLSNYGNDELDGSTTVVILDDSHYITQGYTDGVTDIANSTGHAGYMRNWSSGESNPLAVYTSNPKQARILIIDKDQILVNNEIAKDRRAFFGADWFSNLSPDGINLFNRTLDWVAYNTPEVSFVRDPWVVEHGGKLTVVDPGLKNDILGDTTDVELITSNVTFTVSSSQ